MSPVPVTRREFDQRVHKVNMIFGGIAAAILFILLALAVVLSSLSTRAKTNRVTDLEASITQAVALCQKQNKITDTLVQAAIAIVSAPPNPPEDSVFIAAFSRQHEVLVDPKTCLSLRGHK